MAECLDEIVVNTRKSHQCHGCLKTWPKKSIMTRSVNVNDGKIYSLYFCENCIEYIHDNPDFFKYDDIYPGDLLEDEKYIKKYKED